MLLLDSATGQDPQTVELAAARTVRATLALVDSRHLLGRPADPAVPTARDMP